MLSIETMIQATGYNHSAHEASSADLYHFKAPQNDIICVISIKYLPGRLQSLTNFLSIFKHPQRRHNLSKPALLHSLSSIFPRYSKIFLSSSFHTYVDSKCSREYSRHQTSPPISSLKSATFKLSPKILHLTSLTSEKFIC